MKVLKFGGSSLANAERFISVAEILKKEKEHTPISVVLSAPQGFTNLLVEIVEALNKNDDVSNLVSRFVALTYDLVENLDEKLSLNQTKNEAIRQSDVDPKVSQQLQRLEKLVKGAKLLGHCPEQTAAQILSLGERISIIFLQWVLKLNDIEVALFEPEDFLIAEYQAGDPLADIPTTNTNFRNLHPALSQVSLMPGFVGVSSNGHTVTLGRNGSDYSASILAVCTDAAVCEIWTDVDGVYNADPRLVKDAELISKMSFNEAIELSYFGANVLHPKTITPLRQYDIPCLIRNSQAPEKPGTLISKDSSEGVAIKAISSLNDVAMIDVSGPGMKGKVGMSSRIFSAINRANVPVILISQSSAAYRISFCVERCHVTAAELCLNSEFELELESGLIEPIAITQGLSVISLVGDKMQKQKGIAAKFFSALSQANVNITAIAQDSSERSISAVVKSWRIDDAVSVCHQKLFLKQSRIDVFVLGCGSVGSELLKQIEKQQSHLLARNIQLTVYGIANSRQCLLEPKGIQLGSDWRTKLKNSEQLFELDTIKTFINEHHLHNPVIVDVTTSESISENYVNYLNANFHVVTANKKANTSSLDFYQAIRSSALKHQRRFLYETNVAAGLPVIDNLQSLLKAGDGLLSFEGILSGSLSYIFGQLHQGLSLSEATIKARDLGYTEPNPAEDLSGLDVARKVLIIAREVGLELELEDIQLESVIPPSLAAIADSAQFLEQLPTLDAEITEKVRKAESENRVLRYIAKIQNGECKVAIQAVDKDHPLYSVIDGENALSMHTRYYQPIPFVIRGYGAGASVTAAGLFADVLRTLVLELD